MAIAVPGDFARWTGKAVPADREDALNRAILYATAWVQRNGGRRSLEKEANAVSVTLDGAEARGGPELWLPEDVRPVWHTGGDLVTVSESGVALTVAAGYSATADVQVRGANVDAPVMLYRLGGWAREKQNVVVSCKCGWDAADPPATVLPIPEDVRHLVIEVAWLMFNTPGWFAKPNVSKAGTSVTIANELSPAGQATLEDLRGF